MKRFLILIALVILPVLLSCQERFLTPQTVEWDGENDLYEVAVQKVGTADIIPISEINIKEYTIDLVSLGLSGEYVVLVRGVDVYTDPDQKLYSDWIRSDNPADVIMLDGVAQTFTIVSVPNKPLMMRIK